jgi:hypothetical protein
MEPKRLKKTMAIMLTVLFLVTVTAGAVSAAGIVTESNIATESNVIDANASSTKNTDFLYIGDAAGNGTVKRFNATSGNFTNTFVTEGSGGLVGPFGLVFEKNGNLLLANGEIGISGIPGDILRYNGKTGVFETALATGTYPTFTPNGIVLNNNILYAADLGDIGVPGNVSSYNEHNGKFLENFSQNVIAPINYHPRGLVFVQTVIYMYRFGIFLIH